MPLFNRSMLLANGALLKGKNWIRVEHNSISVIIMRFIEHMLID